MRISEKYFTWKPVEGVSLDNLNRNLTAHHILIGLCIILTH